MRAKRSPRRVGLFGRAFFAATALLSTAATTAWAQGTQQASIVGVVTDESGAVLPGVTVTATSAALQVGKISAVSDSQGAYRLANLPIGTYEVSYALDGFRSVKRESVRLTKHERAIHQPKSLKRRRRGAALGHLHRGVRTVERLQQRALGRADVHAVDRSPLELGIFRIGQGVAHVVGKLQPPAELVAERFRGQIGDVSDHPRHAHAGVGLAPGAVVVASLPRRVCHDRNARARRAPFRLRQLTPYLFHV